jgi:hypothetical protein
VNRLVRWAHSCGWVLTFVLCARSTAAQSLPPAPSTTNNDVHFMPRAAFYLWAEKLSGEDEGYEWDANFGGDLDIVDYTTGRLTFYANYQVIMGGEFRRFDPNQGNYILGGTLSRRARNGFEYAFNFHHESRHLSDRFNRVAVAWNMAGGRVSRVILYGPARFDVRVDARVSVAKAFVDYNWEIDSSVRSDVKVRPKVGLLFAGDLRKLGVDGSQNRDGPIGFRAEAGVHFVGGAGAMEFFVAGEHRIDPYPLEFGSINFVTVGFRLLTR